MTNMKVYARSFQLNKGQSIDDIDFLRTSPSDCTEPQSSYVSILKASSFEPTMDKSTHLPSHLTSGTLSPDSGTFVCSKWRWQSAGTQCPVWERPAQRPRCCPRPQQRPCNFNSLNYLSMQNSTWIMGTHNAGQWQRKERREKLEKVKEGHRLMYIF